MQPWERRLRDLAHLLHNCGEAYFSPDLFRRNTNQFLQTSRTVTFIIQKNKATIPGFDAWYKTNVLQAWATDRVMSWAKDARNVVEKEGDLEMYSTLRVSVLYSYLSDEDMVVEISRRELLRADVDALLSTARAKLPPGIVDAAVLKIQRRWVANSLPGQELIYALTYAYAQLYGVCTALAVHLGSKLDPSIPHPTKMDPSLIDVARVRFIKFRKPGIGRHTGVRMKADPNFQAPPAMLRLKEELNSAKRPASLVEIVASHSKMAQATFEHHGNHVPMLALYDKDWNQVDFISTAFSDQSDKFIFWRAVADRAFYLKAFALVWTSESWIRDFKEGGDKPVRELPIVGEQLQIVGADASDTHEVVAWKIVRPSKEGRPILIPLSPEDESFKNGHIYFIKPVVAAMKLAHANGAV